MYIYVGKLTCSGMLDNGKAWSGLRVACGVCKDDHSEPYVVKVFKVVNDAGVHHDIGDLAPGDKFECFFDEKGRIANVAW